MQRLEVSGAVRHIYRSSEVKGLSYVNVVVLLRNGKELFNLKRRQKSRCSDRTTASTF